MIHFGVLFLVGGVLGAVLRDRMHASSTSTELAKQEIAKTTEPSAQAFDDVGELRHYQKISFYTFALTASGSLFFPPVALISAPLLGYNTYYFLKTIYRSGHWKRSPGLATFEVVGVVGSLLTGRLFIASTVALLGFGSRNLLLQAGNIANNLTPNDSLNLKAASVWVERDGAEVEIKVSEMRDDDIVIIHENDTILLEGTVIEGEGEVRQFSLEKRMKVISKGVGDSVYPFTRLNKGRLYIHCKSPN